MIRWLLILAKVIFALIVWPLYMGTESTAVDMLLTYMWLDSIYSAYTECLNK